MSPVKRLRSFTATEKLKVIHDAEKIGNRAGSHKCDIPLPTFQCVWNSNCYIVFSILLY